MKGWLNIVQRLDRHNRNRSVPRAAVVALASIGVVLGTTIPAVFAATSPISWSWKNIEFSTYTAINVSGYTENGTTYMPVWYVLQALKKSGYTVGFDGKVLSITPPGNMAPNTEGLSVGTGNFAIAVRGHVVKQVQSEVRVDPASGKPTQYIPIYYIQQTLSSLSYYNAWNGTTWTGRPVTVTLQGSKDVEQGQMDAFGLELQNPDGSLFVPMDAVRWSVEGSGSANIDKNMGIFTASSPGTYDVTATVDGFHWTKVVNVYGPAVGVNLKASQTNLMADGTGTSTITVQAVDSNGNVVTNFTGQVLLSIPVAGGSFVGGIESDTNNQVPVYLYNGVGTATLTAALSNPGVAETITASDLMATSQTLPADVHYGAITMTYTTPVVSQIGITPSVTLMDSNSNNSADLKLTLDDAEGNPVTSGPFAGINVTLDITGPGSFAPGVAEATMTEYVFPGTTGVSVPIYATAGQPGIVTVTASGAGVSGTASLSSNPTETSRSLTVSKMPGTLATAMTVGSTTLPAGTSFTLYTATVIDGKGNPLPESDTLWVSDSTVSTATSSGQSGTTDGLTYFSVAGGQPGAALADVGTGTATYAVSTSSATGKAQFIVFNTGSAPAGTAVNIRDIITNASVASTIGSN